MGPTFTLKIAGKRMTFLMNSDDFHHFFQSNKVDFQKAVQPSVEKTGQSFSSSSFSFASIPYYFM